MPLEIAGITKRFGGVTALDGISLAAEDGEFVGAFGPR
jgi:ABC-type branched-subunit amino acid transport system ATPase component